MVKFIRRTVTFSRISCIQVVIENGEPKMVPGRDMVVFSQGLDLEKATALVRKEYGQAFTATRIIEGSGTWEMPLADFVLYGHQVDGAQLKPGEEYDADDSADVCAPDTDATPVPPQAAVDIPAAPTPQPTVTVPTPPPTEAMPPLADDDAPPMPPDYPDDPGEPPPCDDDDDGLPPGDLTSLAEGAYDSSPYLPDEF